MINKGGDKLLDTEIILQKVGVGESMTIADLGCGTSGHFVYACAQAVGSSGRVYAVDILKPVLENIKHKIHTDNLSNIIPIWSNLEVFQGTKIESGSLDIALLINTLYQSSRKEAILREATRLLKKEAILAIVEWKKIDLPFGPQHGDRVDPQNIITMASKLGLDFVEEFFVGKYHYGLIFTKL